MAYGNGAGKDMEKRMADLGQSPMSGDLLELRRKCIETMQRMAQAIFPEDIVDPVPAGKEIDARMLPIQAAASRDGVNNVWAEKCRIMAKSAALEQWKRGQKNLFGRFKNIATRGDKPMKDGHLRLVNMSEDWSRRLGDDYIEALQARAISCDFPVAMRLFAELRDVDAGLTALQADALRAMHDTARLRWGCPEWRDDAIIQLHLDYRCIKGRKRALSAAIDTISRGLTSGGWATHGFALAPHVAHGPGIPIALRLVPDVAKRMDGLGAQGFKALALELGPKTICIKGVVTRPRTAPSLVGFDTVVAEDFGFTNTSSLTVLRSPVPITQERLDFALSEPGKKAVKAYLETHVSGDEIEVLDRVQFDGKDFLDRIKLQARAIDTLRSEVDLGYARLGRIRAEMNRIAGREAGDLIAEALDAVTGSNLEQMRYGEMHGRFFRLLKALQRLKAKRRAIYAAVAELKKAWFGHIANVKLRLAEKYGAAVVREDLSILAVPTDDPAYKGRTFNKMINNGSKGQYIRRSDNKLAWRGIAAIALPSYYTSMTDWRNGRIDKKQRQGARFTGDDGRVWDADDHASEMLGRWLFLRPKLSGALAPV
ncbi:hypothetical protein ACEUZ9_000462 [Paracoccus litorisediminis]|uniref:hypothetical protein n=1 Tax=Paracoccus litorisediminis TaxID=2006130 RepID=UPI00372E2F69